MAKPFGCEICGEAKAIGAFGKMGRYWACQDCSVEILGNAGMRELAGVPVRERLRDRAARALASADGADCTGLGKCPVCLEPTGIDMIVLPCSHAVCQVCTKVLVEEEGPNALCPLCRTAHSKATVRRLRVDPHRSELFGRQCGDGELRDARLRVLADGLVAGTWGGTLIPWEREIIWGALEAGTDAQRAAYWYCSDHGADRRGLRRNAAPYQRLVHDCKHRAPTVLLALAYATLIPPAGGSAVGADTVASFLLGPAPVPVDAIRAVLDDGQGRRAVLLPDVDGLLRRVTDLFAADDERSADCARLLLDYGAHHDLYGRRPSSIYTAPDHWPLFAAAAAANLAVCRLLLEAGADVNEVDDIHGTALFAAVHANSIDVCRLLIAKGADVNLEIRYPRRPATALCVAVADGHYDLCVLLITRASARLRRETAPFLLVEFIRRSDQFSLAACRRALGVGGLLHVEGGVFDVDARSAFAGDTALHVAARLDDAGAAAMLLLLDADVGAVNGSNDTALHGATPGCAVLLLACGAELEARSWSGATPLLDAVRRGDRSKAALLIANGARVDAVDDDHRSVLTVAGTSSVDLGTFLRCFPRTRSIPMPAHVLSVPRSRLDLYWDASSRAVPMTDAQFGVFHAEPGIVQAPARARALAAVARARAMGGDAAVDAAAVYNDAYREGASDGENWRSGMDFDGLLAHPDSVESLGSPSVEALLRFIEFYDATGVQHADGLSFAQRVEDVCEALLWLAWTALFEPYLLTREFITELLVGPWPEMVFDTNEPYLRLVLDLGGGLGMTMEDMDGARLLNHSADRSDFFATRLLLERGVDANAVAKVNDDDQLSTGPLLKAAGNQAYGIVKLLLDHGADANYGASDTASATFHDAIVATDDAYDVLSVGMLSLLVDAGHAAVDKSVGYLDSLVDDHGVEEHVVVFLACRGARMERFDEDEGDRLSDTVHGVGDAIAYRKSRRRRRREDPPPSQRNTRRRPML